MSVTISDIAEKVGVSPMTVSRALRGGGRIGADTRARILATARELGYKPNTAARVMRSGRTGNVGLLLSTDHETSTLPPGLVWGIESALEEKNWNLFLARMPDGEKLTAGELPRVLQQHLVDGLLVNYTHQLPSGLTATVRSQQLPAIWLNIRLDDAPCVYPDDYNSAREATRYLLELGHKKIAYANLTELEGFDPALAHYSTLDRYKGYAQTMQETGLTPRRLWGVELTQCYAHCLAAFKAPDRPTAVLCYNRYTIGAVLLAAAAANLEVPRDLSVCLFHDEPCVEFGRRITTMKLPEFEMGVTAVGMLADWLADPGRVPASKALPCRWYFQEECAKPPA